MSEKIMSAENQRNDVGFNDSDKVLSDILTKLRIEKLKQKLISNTPNSGMILKNWIKSLIPDERKFLAEILLSQKSELEKPKEISENEENKENDEKKLTDKELAKKENDAMEVKILVNVRKFGESIFSKKLLAEFRSPIYGVPFLIYYGMDNAVIGECLVKSVIQTIYPTEEEIKEAGFESREAYNKKAKGRVCYFWCLGKPIKYDSPISLREFAPSNGMARGWKYLYRPVEYVNGKLVYKRKAA